MTKLVEGRHAGEFLLSEANFHRSRDSVLIGASQTITPGTLLGRRAVVATATAQASVGTDNAGTATIAMGAPAVTTKAKPGRYRGVATGATTVNWEDAAGRFIGTSTHGTPFASEIAVTITAGGTPNVAGDEFYVVVAVASEFVVWNPAAVDGTEIVAAIAFYGATTTGVGETVEIAAITRDAEVKGFALAFPEGASAHQARSGLAALGVVVR